MYWKTYATKNKEVNEEENVGSISIIVFRILTLNKIR